MHLRWLFIKFCKGMWQLTATVVGEQAFRAWSLGNKGAGEKIRKASPSTA